MSNKFWERYEQNKQHPTTKIFSFQFFFKRIYTKTSYKYSFLINIQLFKLRFKN